MRQSILASESFLACSCEFEQLQARYVCILTGILCIVAPQVCDWMFPSGTPPTRRYGHTAWSTPYAPDEGGFQITGGTCGTACGACGHANDTFVLQVCDDVFVVDCRRLLVAVGSICSSQRYCLYSCNPHDGMEMHCTHSPRTFTRSVY